MKGAAIDVLRLLSVLGVEGLTHPAPSVIAVSPPGFHPPAPGGGTWIEPTGERGYYAGVKTTRKVRVLVVEDRPDGCYLGRGLDGGIEKWNERVNFTRLPLPSHL